jgi:hypothetical protein
VRFLDDGCIEIDSNTVERAIRSIALSRQNALCAGGDEGAENWTMLASLIESCKLHGVNPEAYLTDVLTKLVNNWPNSSPNSCLGAGCRTLIGVDKQNPWSSRTDRGRGSSLTVIRGQLDLPGCGKRSRL